MVLCDKGSGIVRMPEPGGVYKEPPEVSNRVGSVPACGSGDWQALQ